MYCSICLQGCLTILLIVAWMLITFSGHDTAEGAGFEFRAVLQEQGTA